jgi:hypothetical protein
VTFSYSDPTTILSDYARLLLKDNVEATHILEDEDIAAFAASYPDATVTSRQKFLVVFEGAMALYAHWLRIASGQVGPLRTEASRRAELAYQLAKTYYNLGYGLAPDAPAGSLRPRFAGVLAIDSTADPVEPYFTRISPP